MRNLLLLLATGLGIPAHTAIAQEPPIWSLIQELRLGSLDGPDAFGAIGEIVVSPLTGNLFAAEGHHVLVFDSLGRQQDAIGREGEGPGEFENIINLTHVDGRLVVTDGRLSRLTYLTEAGEVTAMRRLEGVPIENGTLPPRPSAPLSDGGILAHATQEGIGRGQLQPVTWLIRIDQEGRDSVLDRIPGGRWVAAGNGRSWLPIPMVAMGLSDSHPHGDGAVIVHQYEEFGGEPVFRVRRLAADGSLIYARNYAYTPDPLPADYLEDFVMTRRDGLRYFGVSDREAERLIGRELPRFELPIGKVLLAADGQVWLRRGFISSPNRTWWVLDRRGDLVGQLRLPAAMMPRYVNGQTVWAVETDELGVNYLSRYRLDPG